jgi:hypothetical protein
LEQSAAVILNGRLFRISEVSILNGKLAVRIYRLLHAILPQPSVIGVPHNLQ